MTRRLLVLASAVATLASAHARAQALAPDLPGGEDASAFGDLLPPPSGSVVAAEISEDGRLVVVRTKDGFLRAFDGRRLHETARIELPESRGLAVRPDGKAFATLSRGFLVEYDPTGHETLRRPHEGEAGSLAYAPDGSLLVIAGPTLALVPRDAGPERVIDGLAHPLLFPSVHAGTAAYVVEGAKLAALGGDGTLRPIGEVADAAFVDVASDEQRWLTVTSAGDAVIGGASSPAKSVEKPANDAWVSGRFDASGGSVALISKGGRVGVVAVATGKAPRFLPAMDGPAQGVLGHDGRVVVRWTPTHLRVDDTASGVLLVRQAMTPPPIVLLAGVASRFAIATADGTVRVLDAGTGGELLRATLSAAPVQLALSPDGTRLAVGLADGTAQVIDVATSKSRVIAAPGKVLDLVVGDDGTATLLVASDGAIARRVAPEAGAPVDSVLPGAGVTTARLSRSGRLVAGQGERATLLWQGDEAPGELAADTDPASNFAFSDDERSLAVATTRGGIQVWDIATRALRWSRRGAGEAPRSLAFDAGGRRLVAAVGGATLAFDAATGDDVFGVPSTVDVALALPLGGEGERTLVASAAGVVRVWDATSDTTVGMLWSAANGAWASVWNKRLLRADDGTLLFTHGKEAGDLVAAPRPPAEPPHLSVAIAVLAVPFKGAEGKVKVTVSNEAGAGAARGIDVEGGTGDPALRFTFPGRIARLAPGDKVERTITLSRSGNGPDADVRFSVRVTPVEGEPASAETLLHGGSAAITAEEGRLDVSNGRASLRFRLRNSGDAASGALSLAGPFDGPVLVPSLTPGAARSVVVDLAEVPASDAAIRVVAVAVDNAADRWELDVVPSTPPAATAGSLWIVAVVLLLLALAGAGAAALRLHPLARRAAANPASLRELPLSEVPAMDRALRRSWRRTGVLVQAGIDPARWNDVVRVSAGDAEGAARIFAGRVGAKLLAAAGTDPCWLAELPPVKLRLPKRSAIAVLKGRECTPELGARIASRISGEEKGAALALALDLTDTQRAARVLTLVPRISFVTLGENEVRDLLLAEDAEGAFAHLLSSKRPRADLSPYRAAGGIDDDGVFYGRAAELARICDGPLANRLIVGARQAGKSTLMKAARRRFLARGDVDVHHVAIVQDDLAGTVARHLGRPKPTGAEEFAAMLTPATGRPSVWLIDEADGFVLSDSRAGYPMCRAMRAISEEGKATFVLAGFWHLYAAASLNPNNPLRNFGEILRVGPLDKEAALALVRQPLEALGLTWDDAATVELFVEQCGYRAHLLSAACRALVEGVGPEEHQLTRSHLGRVLLESPGVADELKFWRRDAVQRAIVRAALTGESPTRAQLRDRLERAGLPLATDVFDSAVDRLELSYVLTIDATGRLVCPIPLLRTLIMREAPLEQGLARDVADALAQAKPA